MFIVDLAGIKFEILDLEGTIKMIEVFMTYEIDLDSSSLQRLEINRRVYWQDMLDKLLILRDAK